MKIVRLNFLTKRPGRLSFSPVVRPRGHTMPNKEKALLRILRQLNGQRVEEVADHILALFNEPQRWKVVYG